MSVEFFAGKPDLKPRAVCNAGFKAVCKAGCIESEMRATDRFGSKIGLSYRN
ncbi:MAG: hypothetical protein ACI9HK_002692 [Pirellulaceae bacterium]|jgi:hypothetical protein